MSAWLLSIVGVTVVGVLVELLLTDSPMSRFVRSIYSFIILFVIVQPLPDLLNKANIGFHGNIEIDTEYVNSASVRRIEQMLAFAGYTDCIVTFAVDKYYINATASPKTDTAEIISIVTSVTGVSPDRVEVVI